MGCLFPRLLGRDQTYNTPARQERKRKPRRDTDVVSRNGSPVLTRKYVSTRRARDSR